METVNSRCYAFSTFFNQYATVLHLDKVHSYKRPAKEINLFKRGGLKEID